MRARLYRDLVHGQIRLLRPIENEPCDPASSEKAIAFLLPLLRDTPAFQRLRSIRQNGLTNFVFAPMEHSRFAHSMGTFEMCRRMFDSIVRNSQIKFDQRERTLVAIAGLLHDIGHGPFSHSFEKALDGFSHEDMTVRLLQEHEPIARTLELHDSKFVDDIVPFIDTKSRQTDRWSYRIVSSQLDADRMDYMLRDCKLSGLDGHGFDLARLLDLLSVDEGKLTVDEVGTPTIEAYLLMRLHLHEIVYFHKGVRGAQLLLISLFLRCFDLIKEGKLQHLELLSALPARMLSSLVETPGDLNLEDYVRFGEHHCWVAFDEWAHGAEDLILRDLASRIVSRRPFKAITLLDDLDNETLLQQRNKASSRIASRLKWSEENVVRYCCSIDEPQTLAYKVFDPDGKKPEEEIWFRSRQGNTRKLSAFTNNAVFSATKIPRVSKFLIFPPECKDIAEDLFAHKEYEGS